MTSNAKLIAFDDDRDEAILEFSDGRIFACPTDYVTITQVMRKMSLACHMNKYINHFYFAIQAFCKKRLLKNQQVSTCLVDSAMRGLNVPFSPLVFIPKMMN